MKRPLVGFAGMTHLGLVSGICAAEKGFKVLCFDTDPTRIDPLKRTILPISEPQLLELENSWVTT
jgi:UDPglucose 6-dehydrogenase